MGPIAHGAGSNACLIWSPDDNAGLKRSQPFVESDDRFTFLFGEVLLL
jgi:hypothetical protein